ncbi:MAG: DUF992 domain-containing protein [Alphaproteobacteria bacterium]|nr:DUF992 domain-containing protein [Alphaproteobacteria bacterium]
MAQSRVEVGVLDCRGSTSSFVVGSVTELSCTFNQSGGRPEPYRATMKRIGVDIGFNQQVAVAWGVFAPSSGGRYDLSGTYVGGAASATVGIGVGANALIGGSGNTFALQPASVQGQTGFSAAAGIASLELRPGGR